MMTWRRASTVIALAVAAAASVPPATSGSAISPAASPAAGADRIDPPARTLNVIASGDVLTESRVRASAARFGAASGRRFDFAALFAPIREVIQWGHLAICHAELPIGAPGQRPGFYGRSPFGGSLLLSPHELAADLATTGFNRCSTASNHSFDLGQPGIVTTLDALEQAGISTIGTQRGPVSAPTLGSGRIAPEDTIVQANGVTVAHLAYTRYSNTVRPAGWSLWFANSPTAVAADVDAARRAGAELVIVSVHLSQELLTGPTVGDRAFATELVRLADVDAVIHHGPHVVQPFELVDGVPVYWSLGNFVSEMGEGGTGRYAPARTSDGLLAALRFVELDDGSWDVRATAVAVCNDPGTRIVRAATVTLADPTLGAVHPHIAACLGRIRSLVPTAE